MILMKKIIAFLLAVTAIIAVFAGCASNKNQSQNVTSTTEMSTAYPSETTESTTTKVGEDLSKAGDEVKDRAQPKRRKK